MNCAETTIPKPARQLRTAVAYERARAARSMLADCHLCAHRCGVNRLSGERGLCHAGEQVRFFSAQVEVGDEPELIPAFNVALSGCDLRCDFCITGASSWNPAAGAGFDVSAMAARARRALDRGARSVMLLGGEPTIHLPAALEFVAALPASATLVWKTNAHGSAEARELLDGMFDVWIADYKFGNEGCARRLAKVPDYVQVVQENLRWASGHTELIVRHLLMPGHLECCWKPVAEWLAAELPRVKVSLRTGFWPAWHSARHHELRGSPEGQECAEALRLARGLGLRLFEPSGNP
jgi:putative pyruvate formate lyase activating enzyme